ncbi:MAG: TaqI-like C-terminal specificity domain-containing protein [Terriglobales bacterium]
MKRWRAEPKDLWLIFVRHGTEIKKYPAIYRHLKDYKSRLEPKPNDWDAKRDGVWPGRKPGSYDWFEIQDNVAYWQQFERPKIIIPAITDNVNYASDDHGFYSNDKTSIAIPPSVPFCLAILNSQISWWYTRQLFASKQGGFYEFKPMYVSQIPIPQPPEKQRRLVERLAEYVMWLHADSETNTESPQASYFEQLLNGLVYELFFEQELHAEKLFLFEYLEQVGPPKLGQFPKAKQKPIINEFYEKIADLNHPIRSCLFSLRSLEVVRIIEGE